MLSVLTRRDVKRLAIFWLLAAALGIAGVAFAAWVVQLPIVASIDTAAFEMVWYDVLPVEVNDDGSALVGWDPNDNGNDPTAPGGDPARTASDFASCSISYVGPAQLDFAILSAYPGYVCSWRAGVQNTGDLSAKLQGWSLTGVDGEILADMITTCGIEQTPGAGVTITEGYFEIDPSSAPGTNYAGTFALDWIEATSYDALNCP